MKQIFYAITDGTGKIIFKQLYTEREAAEYELAELPKLPQYAHLKGGEVREVEVRVVDE